MHCLIGLLKGALHTHIQGVSRPLCCSQHKGECQNVGGRVQTAMELARRLEEHPRIARVHYPGLPSHPDHHIAVDQMLGGFGGVISFEVSFIPSSCILTS